MRKFTNEIAALLATAAVGAAMSAGSSSAEETEMVRTAGVAMNTDVPVTTMATEPPLMGTYAPEIRATTTTPEIPALLGEVMIIPEEYITTTTAIPPLAGTYVAPATVTTIANELPPLMGQVTMSPEELMTTTMPPLQGLMMPDTHPTTTVAEIPPLAGTMAPETKPTTTASEIQTTTTVPDIPPLAGVIAPTTTTTPEVPPLMGTMAPETETTTMPPVAGGFISETTTTPTDEPDFPPLMGQVAIPDGDINSDGQFSVSDIITLSDFLLNNNGNVKIWNWYAADLNEDGVINAYDFVLLKKLYTYSYI